MYLPQKPVSMTTTSIEDYNEAPKPYRDSNNMTKLHIHKDNPRL